jgi:hypothetical protein
MRLSPKSQSCPSFQLSRLVEQSKDFWSVIWAIFNVQQRQASLFIDLLLVRAFSGQQLLQVGEVFCGSLRSMHQKQ